MITRLFWFWLLILLAVPAQGQPVCVTKELPVQVQANDSSINLQGITVPAHAAAYPPELQYFQPWTATRVGLISWAHAIPAGVPRDKFEIWGLVCQSVPAPHCMLADAYSNDGSDGVWVSRNLSRPLNHNEHYLTGLFNNSDRPVTIHAVLTYQECK